MKQDIEISNSKQLSLKKLKRKFTEDPQVLPPGQKSDCRTPLASITQFETDPTNNHISLVTCNTSSKNCSYPRADEIITIDDDDDESDYPLDKSTQYNTYSRSHLPSFIKNENVIEKQTNTDIEDIRNYEFPLCEDINDRYENLNNHTSTSNYNNQLKSRVSIDPVKYQVPQEFCPIPSTSKDDKTICQNEQIFKDFYSEKCIVTDNLEIIKNPCEPMITENTDNQQLSVITKVESQIDTIDLSNIDVENVIAENEFFLEKLRNERQRRIEKSIEVIKPDPDEIIKTTNDPPTQKQIGKMRERCKVKNKINMYRKPMEFIQNKYTPGMKLTDHVTSLAKCHELPSIDLSQNVSSRNSVHYVKSSLKKTNDQSREVETRIRNSPNHTITNLSTDIQSSVVQLYTSQLPDSIEIIPITTTPVKTRYTTCMTNSLNMPLDRSTTQSIGQSSNSQINNANQNLLTTDNQKVPCNFCEQVSCKNTAQTSNTVMGPERKSPDQNLLQNVTPNVEHKPNTISPTCPICIEPLYKKKVASTLCGHIFCMPCIEAAFKYPPIKCPTCRKKLTGEGYHLVYIY